MSYSTSKRGLASKIVSIGLMVTTFVWLVGVPTAGAATTAETIAALMAQIQSLQSQLVALQGGSSSTTSTTSGATACNFTRSLTIGARGADVTCLQQYLTSTGHFTFSGGATGYFGSVTRTAVAAWQTANGVNPPAGYFGAISMAKYAAVGGSSTTTTTTTTPGSTTTTTTTTPVATGTGLTVTAAADQPPAGLFGEYFASRPFTKVNLTASNDGDVVVKSITVQRTGQAVDAVFSGIILLDENGLRVGTSKTLNSNHQVILNEPFTVAKGTTRSMSVAADAPASATGLDAYAGQVATLSIVAVDAGSATVNGSLPITGNAMTINATLVVGTATLTRGTRDPGVSLTKSVGDTGVTFSALKITAGSAEDLTLKSVRWNQAGSAATGDTTNILTYVDGSSTTYPVTVSSDGKYYTSSFGSAGLTIAKGDSKELYIKGDIAGGSARTISFDLYRYADLQLHGLTFGYDILPTASEVAAVADDGAFHAAQPNFDAFKVTVSNGTMNVSKSTSVAADNIAVNLAKQPFGGFDVEVKGEQITVATLKFDVSIAKAAGETVDTNDLTSVALYDASGNVVAGPVDGVAGGVNAISFTDTVTFPVGKNTYKLMGKVGTDIGNNDTITASTTPATQWATVKGVTTGNSITPAPATAVTANTMTVKSASLNITTSPTPAAQSVVAGTNTFTFANFVFDASGSGEDIRTTSIKPTLTFVTANTADDLSNCQLFDGATALNTGSNIVNPDNTNTTGNAVAFNFDSGLTITKKTVKTITLKCNVRANPDGTSGTSTYNWGLAPGTAANIVSTGLTSGQAVTETGTTSVGQLMTLRTGGTLAVITDTSSPQLKWIQAGASDQTLAVFRINSTYEDIRLERMGFQIATSADTADTMASNTPSDISKISLWNGAKKIGEATFSSGDYATSTFTTEYGAAQTDYTIAKDDQMLLTVKGDIGTIGVNAQAYPGHLIVVNYDGQNGDTDGSVACVTCGLKGTGLSSGTAIYDTSNADQTTNGARIARAIPTVERVALSSTKFSNVSGQTLYKFKVTAPSGTLGVSLYKFTFLVSTSVGGYLQEFQTGPDALDPPVSDFRVSNYQVWCYEDTLFSTASCGNTSGLLNDSGVSDFSTIASTTADNTNDQEVRITFNPLNPTSATAEAITVPAGSTRYFALKADITGASSTPSITVKMQGDAQLASLNNAEDGENIAGSDKDLSQAAVGDNWTTGRYVFATTAVNVDAWDDDDFIWSGNSTNTSMSVAAYDWFNGFQVPGLSNTDNGTTETLTLTN